MWSGDENWIRRASFVDSWSGEGDLDWFGAVVVFFGAEDLIVPWPEEKQEIEVVAAFVDILLHDGVMHCHDCDGGLEHPGHGKQFDAF